MSLGCVIYFPKLLKFLSCNVEVSMGTFRLFCEITFYDKNKMFATYLQ